MPVATLWTDLWRVFDGSNSVSGQINDSRTTGHTQRMFQYPCIRPQQYVMELQIIQGQLTVGWKSADIGLQKRPLLSTRNFTEYHCSQQRTQPQPTSNYCYHAYIEISRHIMGSYSGKLFNEKRDGSQRQESPIMTREVVPLRL